MKGQPGVEEVMRKTKQSKTKIENRERKNTRTELQTEKQKNEDSSTHRLIIISMRFKRAENVKPKQVTPRVKTSKSQVLADLDLPLRAKITHAGRGRE